MEDVKLFLEWLLSLPLSQYVLDVLAVVFSLVVMIVQVKKYKYLINQQSEVNLKYRSEDYMLNKGFRRSRQSFSKIVPVYDLDEKTNSLVVVGTKDLQELVQSSRDCGLDVVLEKYGALPPVTPPKVSEVTSEPFDFTDVRDDFEVLSDFNEEVEAMRERYNMPLASSDELFKHITGLKSKLDKSIHDELSKQKKDGDNNG